MKNTIIIIGAGISGAVLAERYANVLNKKVIIIEKRNHIGGNCYDFYNKDGLLIPKYGPHFFHTDFEDVWRYANQFTKWYPYKHKVLSYVDKKLVPVPVNIETVNTIFSLNMKTEEEMKKWLKNNVKKIKNPKNSEESALSMVGKILYQKMFKNYTKKQWDMWPSELSPSVINRIPIKTNFDDRYFTDKYQGMPDQGYSEMFKKMLNHPNIEIRLNTDYFNIKDNLINFDKLFFTGRIDEFFNYKFKKLQYRSLRFKYKTLNKEYFQERAQINYPNDNDFTRITEPKHSTGQKNSKTTIIKEYPTWKGDPYYPVPSPINQEIFSQYQKLAEKLKSERIYFVGRLADYKYYNMDQAIKNALDLFKKL